MQATALLSFGPIPIVFYDPKRCLLTPNEKILLDSQDTPLVGQNVLEGAFLKILATILLCHPGK